MLKNTRLTMIPIDILRYFLQDDVKSSKIMHSAHILIGSIKYTSDCCIHSISKIFLSKTTWVFDRKNLIQDIRAGALRSDAEGLSKIRNICKRKALDARTSKRRRTFNRLLRKTFPRASKWVIRFSFI
jgi:hypothetical protein